MRVRDAVGDWRAMLPSLLLQIGEALSKGPNAFKSTRQRSSAGLRDKRLSMDWMSSRADSGGKVAARAPNAD